MGWAHWSQRQGFLTRREGLTLVSALCASGPASGLVSFPTEASFTETWWFAAASLAVLVSLLWGGFRLRVRSLRLREQRAEEIVAERTRELQEEFGYRLQVEEGLRESEERFRAFVEQSSEGIILVDERGRTIEWNRAMEEITGTPRENALGRPIREIQNGAFDPSGDRHLAAGLDADIELRRADGRQVFVQQATFRLPTSRGVGAGSLIRDVTARRHAEQEREALIDELESRNAELERFTYTVSHDLRSPLVTVRGFLGYLEKHAAAGRMDDLRSDVMRIHRATSRMDDLLRDLLELSRVGRMVNPRTTVPLRDIVRDAVELLQGAISERSVRLTVAADLPEVRGDRVRLVEVVQNLLDNAIKFGGSNPTVEIGWRGHDPGGMAILFVRDEGIGIDERHLHRVFGLFDKLDPQVEGTGIGLAIVKRVIEVHGGRVWAESDGPGRGTTLCFTLPVPQPENQLEWSS